MIIHIVVSLMMLTLAARGFISSRTIETDLHEIVRLHKEFLDRSPPGPGRQVSELRCRAVVECCPNEQDRIYDLFSESQFHEKCLSNRTKTSSKPSFSRECISTLHRLIQLTKDPIYDRYFQVLGSNTNRANRIKIWKKQMKIACSYDELRAYYCERSNLEKFKSCQRKVLEMVADENSDDDDTIIYSTYVSQWEQEYAIDNQRLTKAFPRNE